MTNFDLLPPETLAEAENAWRRAQEKKKEAQLSTSRSLGAASFLDTLNTAVEEAKKKDETGFGLECIANPETRQAFMKTFELSKRLVGYLDLSAPTSEQMISAGVDFQYLAEQFESMKQQEGATPHVVLAPHGLGKENWITIARKMTADTTIPNNPLKVSMNMHGLYFGHKIGVVTDDVWCSSDQPPTSTTTPGLDILPTYQDEDSLNINWTLRLISGRNESDHPPMSYQESQEQTPPIQHQTIAEALTDKFTNILAGSEPTDSPLCWILCRQPNPDITESLSVSSKIDSGCIHVTQRSITLRDINTRILSPIG